MHMGAPHASMERRRGGRGVEQGCSSSGVGAGEHTVGQAAMQTYTEPAMGGSSPGSLPPREAEQQSCLTSPCQVRRAASQRPRGLASQTHWDTRDQQGMSIDWLGEVTALRPAQWPGCSGPLEALPRHMAPPQHWQHSGTQALWHSGGSSDVKVILNYRWNKLVNFQLSHNPINFCSADQGWECACGSAVDERQHCRHRPGNNGKQLGAPEATGGAAAGRSGNWLGGLLGGLNSLNSGGGLQFGA